MIQHYLLLVLASYSFFFLQQNKVQSNFRYTEGEHPTVSDIPGPMYRLLNGPLQFGDICGRLRYYISPHLHSTFSYSISDIHLEEEGVLSWTVGLFYDPGRHRIPVAIK